MCLARPRFAVLFSRPTGFFDGGRFFLATLVRLQVALVWLPLPFIEVGYGVTLQYLLAIFVSCFSTHFW